MPTRFPDLSAFPLPSELPSQGDSVQRPELAEFIEILETVGPGKPAPDLPTIIPESPDDMPGGGSGDAEQSEDDAGMPDGPGQFDDSAGGDSSIIGGGGNGGGKDDW